MSSDSDRPLFCPICGDKSDFNLSVSSSSRLNTKTSIFQCFLKIFRAKWKGKTFSFCNPCGNQLILIAELQVKLEKVEKTINIFGKVLQTKFESSEVTFKTRKLYQKDVRYSRLRKQILRDKTDESSDDDAILLPEPDNLQDADDNEQSPVEVERPPEQPFQAQVIIVKTEDNDDDDEEEDIEIKQEEMKVKPYQSEEEWKNGGAKGRGMKRQGEKGEFEKEKKKKKASDELPPKVSNQNVIRRLGGIGKTLQELQEQEPERFKYTLKAEYKTRGVKEQVKSFFFGNEFAPDASQVVTAIALGERMPPGVVASVKRFNCNQEGCEGSFVFKKELEKHVREQHLGGEKEKHLCVQCGAMVVHLDHHIKIKHVPEEEKVFECEADGCSKKFSRIFLLNQHVRKVHPKGDPFQCEVCGKNFKIKRHLDQHQVIHGRSETV